MLHLNFLRMKTDIKNYWKLYSEVSSRILRICFPRILQLRSCMMKR